MLRTRPHPATPAITSFVSCRSSFGGLSAFLESVPMEPFSGKPMVYQPTAKNWILYSIGPDRTDDGGKPAAKIMSGDYMIAFGISQSSPGKHKGDLLYDSEGWPVSLWVATSPTNNVPVLGGWCGEGAPPRVERQTRRGRRSLLQNFRTFLGEFLDKGRIVSDSVLRSDA
jgi:hypothetical protein